MKLTKKRRPKNTDFVKSRESGCIMDFDASIDTPEYQSPLYSLILGLEKNEEFEKNWLFPDVMFYIR